MAAGRCAVILKAEARAWSPEEARGDRRGRRSRDVSGMIRGVDLGSELTRISQRVAAARAQWPTMTALRLIRVLDVLTRTSPLPNRRAPCPRGPLRPLASRRVEICGLIEVSTGC